MSYESRLDRLAQIVVQIGVNVQRGQELIINASTEASPLVRLIAKHAYQAGASNVFPLFRDEQIQLIRHQNADDASFDYAPTWFLDGLTNALEGGAAMLSVVGDDPDLLAGQDPLRIARAQRSYAVSAQGIREQMTNFATNWSIISYVVPPWSRLVFPGVPDAEATDKLWDAVFRASRVDGDDPVAGWHAHAATLRKRCEMLNGKRFAALHFRGPGTDLRVGLADDHSWAGGSITAKNGVTCLPNMPTEEVFTMPHKNRVDGIVSATKPLSYGGTVIEKISVRFEAGRIVEATAKTGQDLFRSLLDTDDGARRLGEVALVPDASPISQSGLLFRNTLFDENAASHVALGQSLAINARHKLDPGNGANESLIHVDWMIGSAHIDVDGIHADDSVEPVMRQGAWA